MVPFKILKKFNQFVALSTGIRKIANSFVFLTSDFVIWLLTLTPGGASNLEK